MTFKSNGPTNAARPYFPGAVAGVQPKVAVVLVDGKFVESSAEHEGEEALTNSNYLADEPESLRLAVLARKDPSNVAAFRRHIRQGLLRRYCYFPLSEIDSAMADLDRGMGWPPTTEEVDANDKRPVTTFRRISEMEFEVTGELERRLLEPTRSTGTVETVVGKARARLRLAML